MIYKIAADLVVFTHFLWILFMLAGVFLTVYHLLRKNDVFFNRWIFRTVHFLGILYVAALAVLNEYCPLTIFENHLRSQHNPSLVYAGSFIVHYIESFVYPSVDPMIVIIPTAVLGLFITAVYILKPPDKIKRLFSK